jgi:hypothetical protein
MLSSKAGVTRDPIRGHTGATYGEIVFNLQAVALNVLEPIKKIYPNMFVTSAFRDPGNASNAKTSQHPLGQGVDIQFKGITKKDLKHIEEASYINLMKLAIDFSDGIAFGCEVTNPEIIKYAKKSGKPILEYKGEAEYADAYNEFYDMILEESIILTD